MTETPPDPDTIRAPIESEFNDLRDGIEKQYVTDREDLHATYLSDLEDNRRAKEAAMVEAGLGPDGSTPIDYYPRESGQVIVPDAPENTSLPTITGTEQVGHVLHANNGVWTGFPTFSKQWVRADDNEGLNDENITGEQGTHYTLVEDDEGKFIRLDVTGTNDGGQASASSEYTGAIDAAP